MLPTYALIKKLDGIYLLDIVFLLGVAEYQTIKIKPNILILVHLALFLINLRKKML